MDEESEINEESGLVCPNCGNKAVGKHCPVCGICITCG